MGLRNVAFNLEAPRFQRELRLWKVVADKKKLRRRDGAVNAPERKSLIFRFRGSKRRNEYRSGAGKSE